MSVTLSDEPITRPADEARPSGSLEGKRALVTGGTTGIGRATAITLAEAGADVFIFGRHRQELEDALAQIRSRTRTTVAGTTADQTDQHDIDRVFDQIDSELGGLDILINNAGIGGSALMDSEFGDWEYLLRSNFLGHVACARAAIDRMKAVGQGHIVHIGSVSADLREADDQLYAASKAAIQAFSASLRKSLSGDGIKVSLIEPGSVGTDLVADQIPPEEQRRQEERGEMLMAEDIADCVLYLLTRPDRVTIDTVRITPSRQAE